MKTSPTGLCCLLLGMLLLASAPTTAGAQRFTIGNLAAQDKQVKIYGVGGPSGLEAYQSGFMVSETGHILTVWSYVLDTDDVTIVLSDGRRFTGAFVGADPRLEIAILKIEADGLPFFDLNNATELSIGDRVLAFSNMYGIASGSEAASLLQGYVSAVGPLSARRGANETPYKGTVYVVDAMTNNAGAAGGALTNYRGQLAGLLGKEIRNTADNLWLNYAIPANELRGSVQDIIAGKSRPRAETASRRPDEFVTLQQLGIVLIPNVLTKTPPYVVQTVVGSPAEQGGLLPDDLIVMVGDTVVQSRQQVVDELSFIDRLDPVRLTLLRDQDLVPVDLIVKTDRKP